jgi:hypothetical protein
MPLDASESVVDDAGGIKLEELDEVETLESELAHARTTIERQERERAVLQHEYNNEKKRNENLRAELVRLEAPKNTSADKYLAPVGSLVDGVKSIDQARTLLAEVSTRIAEAMEQRDLLLEYVLKQAPDAPEKQERQRVEQTGESGHSWIGRLRIGKKDKVKFCEKCGAPSKDYCSAHLFLGFYESGNLGEVFVKLDRRHANELAGGGYHLAAKLGSLALQHGATEASIVKQCRYQKDGSAGRPWGDEGPRKDITGVSSLTDYVGVTIEKVLAERDKLRQEHEAALAAEAEEAAKDAAQDAPTPPADEPKT